MKKIICIGLSLALLITPVSAKRVASESDISDVNVPISTKSEKTPIYDANGNIDMNACRRVSFKFVVNIG